MLLILSTCFVPGRSREGAWIEILYHENLRAYVYRRSREGAWIEIACVIRTATSTSVAPARERGLKYFAAAQSKKNNAVAPARERGLKL